MSLLLDHAALADPAGAVAAWPPTRFTPPLRPDHKSIFERFQPWLMRAWRDSRGYDLEPWQQRLLHAITELRDDGHLRHRQVVVSLGRQNGKTEIAAALGLLFMLAKLTAYVVGIASSAEQARLVYDRANSVAGGSRDLRPRFGRLTETRGLSTTTGGKWELKAAKSAALQGLPIDLGLADELHLLKPALWTDLVNGLGGRPDCMVVGITTAGDDSSELLKDLYTRDGVARFIWEAPEPSMPTDDATLGRWLRMANPSVASGRIDLATVIEDVRAMPADQAIRYRLNRFVSGTDNAYLTVPDWRALTGPTNITHPVVTIDRAPDWSYATITVSAKADDGVIETEVVWAEAAPTVEKLVAACENLAKHAPAMFVVDGYNLRALGDALKRRGYPVRYMSLGDEIAAASMMYAKVMRREIRHPGDELLARQLPRTIRKAHGEGYKLARIGSEPIDAVMATVRGVYVAETTEPAPAMQLF